MNNSLRPISEVSAAKPATASRTDWERIDAMSDDDIDTSDIPPLTEAELTKSWWRFPVPIPSSEGRLS